MPNLHDIERRINSVSSTKQITRTMEMVAAAKIRKSTERMEGALPWARAVSDMLISTAPHAPIDSEPLLRVHDDVKRALVVVVTSDRGLAGGFNSTVLRAADGLIREKEAAGVSVEVAACGKKAIGYFNYRGVKPVFEFAGMSADPSYEESVELSKYIAPQYAQAEGPLDEVYVVFNHAKNAAEQTLVMQQVLPISRESYAEILGLVKAEEDVFMQFREPTGDFPAGDIDYEPDASTVMHWLMMRYIRNSVNFALLDSAAGEQGARRNAMKSATDNANDMVATLTRVYNRVRQGAITTEINEIVGGAAALEE